MSAASNATRARVEARFVTIHRQAIAACGNRRSDESKDDYAARVAAQMAAIAAGSN